MVKQRKISQNYLDFICVPNPVQKWTEEMDGRIVVDIVHRGFYPWIAQKFFHRPKVSHIRLDDYGSKLWKEMDGEQTVDDIIQKMKQYFPAEQDRMLDRVVAFMGTLERNHFIVKQ